MGGQIDDLEHASEETSAQEETSLSVDRERPNAENRPDCPFSLQRVCVESDDRRLERSSHEYLTVVEDHSIQSWLRRNPKFDPVELGVVHDEFFLSS